MSVTQISPYLYFYGRASQAIEHYQHVLGAKLETVLRFKDIPNGEVSPANADRIAHAVLRIDGQLVMLSDGMASDAPATGGNVYISLDFDDNVELCARYDALAATGKVELPVHDTFWGGKLGMLTDAFGIHWLFVSSAEPSDEKRPLK
jgi:PhnB protein